MEIREHQVQMALVEVKQPPKEPQNTDGGENSST